MVRVKVDAAAIDDYELCLRFMNDLATYRIDVSWLWTLVHHQAAITSDLFAELDRRGDPGRFDRAKAPVICPRYIQHSARVLFVVGAADREERTQIFEAIFDLSREEIVRRVQAGRLSQKALGAHDYVYDIFPGASST